MTQLDLIQICPECEHVGWRGFIKVGPFKWWGIHCDNCLTLTSTEDGIWEWLFETFFWVLWDGDVYVPW